ncbi:hypothetical protein BC332_21507 [Capsicum chinense]|nr:hypothetical protein BC332_21507 [Capsicum chinense]
MNKSNQITLGKTAITSNHAFKLEFVPEWIAIVGSGYRELEFSDVYTALGSEVQNDTASVLSLDVPRLYLLREIRPREASGPGGARRGLVPDPGGGEGGVGFGQDHGSRLGGGRTAWSQIHGAREGPGSGVIPIRDQSDGGVWSRIWSGLGEAWSRIKAGA